MSRYKQQYPNDEEREQDVFGDNTKKDDLDIFYFYLKKWKSFLSQAVTRWGMDTGFKWVVRCLKSTSSTMITKLSGKLAVLSWRLTINFMISYMQMELLAITNISWGSKKVPKLGMNK